MADILKFRQQFYENWYDSRILCERNETPESVANKILAKLERRKHAAGYVSTRGDDLSHLSFNDVLLQGLAPDGGLIVPRAGVPELSLGQLQRLVDLTYPERALRVLETWISREEIEPRLLRQFVTSAYSADAFQHPDICPVRELTGYRGQFIQELFHGPTASFKDFALQIMPRMFVNALKETGVTEK